MKQFKKNLTGEEFLVFGDFYPDELVFCVSLSRKSTLAAATIVLSMDLPADVAEKPEKVTEKLKNLVDVAASWFSQCFEKGKGIEAALVELREASPTWQAFQWEGDTVHVLLNKMNFVLESAADELLKKSGFKEPVDDLEEFDPDQEDEGGFRH